VTAILGVGFLVIDRLPKQKDPDVLTAALAQPTFDRPVLLRQYLESRSRVGAFKTALRKSHVPNIVVTRFMQTAGVQVNYELHIRGATGMAVVVAARMYPSGSRSVAPAPPLGQTEHYTTRAGTQTVSGATWIPQPIKPGRYYVEVKVQLDQKPPNDEILATRRSVSFAVPNSRVVTGNAR
jgi:hypothetical protein